MILLLACAGPSPAEAFRTAIAGDIALEDALVLCARAADDEEECVATVVRGHADAPMAACQGLQSERWRSECAFGIAESRAKAGDRWGALEGCGLAGAYYDECLYHAWTFELQLAAEALDGGAVNNIGAARPIVSYWAEIATVGAADGTFDAEELLWADWWFFALSRNRPAVLAACSQLADATDRGRCEVGTRTYVRRTVTEALIRSGTPADTRDRICRGTVADALALLGDLYVPDPALDLEVAAAVAAGCAGGKVERPWNPVFRARLGGVVPKSPGDQPSGPG